MIAAVFRFQTEVVRLFGRITDVFPMYVYLLMDSWISISFSIYLI
jgi:hypothetical protein